MVETIEVIEIDTREKALVMARAALEKKAERLLVYDIREITSIADYFIICSGNTSRQANAIADEIDYTLSKQGVYPHHVEGMPECKWVLMDYGDVVVHVFDAETRDFYDLEGLWGFAPAVEVA
ncbi:MAG: ribosome silencing factor [Nitrospirae bacterium]|nr:ribosome silencing factor [Nitrospirota bacterium]MBI5695555.1 ribosome silencing factor [Nitrospirota bacterium]